MIQIVFNLFLIFIFINSCNSNKYQEIEVIQVNEIIKLKTKISEKDSINSSLQNSINLFEKKIKYLEATNQDLRNSLSQSIFTNRDSTFIILGLINDNRENSNYVWAWPLAKVKRNSITRPERKFVKFIFDSSMNVYSILYANRHTGYLKNYSEYNEDGTKLEYLQRPDSSIKFSSDNSFFSIATNKYFSNDNVKNRRQANPSEIKNIRDIAKQYLTKQNLSINDLNKITLEQLDILKPAGIKDSLAVASFNYEEEFGEHLRYHYLFFIKSYNSEPDSFLFNSYSKTDPIREKVGRSMEFLDIFDYDRDGVDEFILVGYGYESREVIFYKIIDGKLSEIYSIPTETT
jgi:hypothetical protein